MVALARIGDRHGNGDAGQTAVGRECLRPVEHPSAGYRGGGGPRPAGIASGSRLGQAPGTQGLAPREPGQHPRPLQLGTEHVHVGSTEPVVRGDGQRDCRIDPGQLLDTDAVFERRHAGATVAFRELNAKQPELGELGQKLEGKPLRFVPRHDVRRNLPFRELPYRAPRDAFGVGRPKVHGVGLYHTGSRRLAKSSGLRRR